MHLVVFGYFCVLMLFSVDVLDSLLCFILKCDKFNCHLMLFTLLLLFHEVTMILSSKIYFKNIVLGWNLFPAFLITFIFIISR